MKLDPNSDLYRMRHSAAHVMAAAVCRLFEDVQLDIGPPTEDGFYYDFDMPHRLTPEDFESIEAEMNKIVAEDQPFEVMEVSREEARGIIDEKGQRYKVERLGEIPESDQITFYRNGEFLDLCRGPHVESTGKIKAFKLLSVAGSYFHGIETNPMLQRVYATAHPTDKLLRVYLKQLEEAKKRDHRKLGKELDLFSIQDDIGPGLILWHPKGARVRTLIESYWRDSHYKAGYDLVYTPHIGRSKLWETSGHLDFYSEGMFAPMDVDGNQYYAKPMNCPFHIKIFQSRKRSYRELPIRMGELGTVYRYEKAGVLHGLLRVRGFTQDDAHIFCTEEQIKDEISEVIRFAIDLWAAFGFTEISYYLATRPDKAVGDDEQWVKATDSLESALQDAGLPYEVDPGGGAFYGPKIDMKIRDTIGREWQMSTIQFDFNLPARFNMTYTGEDGQSHQPYMVHRALFGSMERFFGILLENFAGAFPLWLAHEQVRVLPLTEKQLDYAEQICQHLSDEEFRVSVDTRSEKVGAKIRNAQLEKVPYMLIVGPKEMEQAEVAVRSRVAGDQGAMKLQAFVEKLGAEVSSKGAPSEPAGSC
jgi:threonyl-tRNA synthetase